MKEGISKDQLFKEILSGVIVGIVALPLAIAFAIASGVSPDKGLITAIIGGFIISALGGSRVQIGGPTGAFIVIVYSIVHQYGVDGLTIATFMAGFIIIGMGLARLGNYLKFIPYPLIVGFTSGIAVIIFSSQIRDFFGLEIADLPSGFIDKWILYAGHINHINWYEFSIASITVLITINFYRISTKIPGSLVSILLSVLFVRFFHFPVNTIESSFGVIPNHLSVPSIPVVDFSTVSSLVQPAFAIALLGGIESLLSAVVSDGMTGGKHRSNMELVAQGTANIFSSLFGGIPVTGAIARTATNVKNGGRTPVAGIVHSIVLLFIMLVLAPYAKLIPLSCLAGILVVVAYNMSEWRQFRTILKGNRMDVIVLLTTFFLTVIFDLVIAIEIGTVLSSFLFMHRMSESLQVEKIIPENGNDEVLFQNELNFSSDEIMLYEINGPLFFGAAKEFQDALSNTFTKPRIIILRMRYVPFIDATGFYRLKEIVKRFRTAGIKIILSGVREELKKDFEKNDMYSAISEDSVFENIESALEHAKSFIEIEDTKKVAGN